jgi:hypothetical protein
MIYLSFSETFGSEYRIPVNAIIDVNKIPNRLLVQTGIESPITFVIITNSNAWPLETFPDDIGRLVFPLLRSRSASNKSLSTYMPVIMRSVDIGRRKLINKDRRLSKDPKMLP